MSQQVNYCLKINFSYIRLHHCAYEMSIKFDNINMACTRNTLRYLLCFVKDVESKEA